MVLFRVTVETDSEKKKAQNYRDIRETLQINKRYEENELWYALQKIAFIQNLWAMFEYMQILSMKTWS
jgi:hypothetical protein